MGEYKIIDMNEDLHAVYPLLYGSLYDEKKMDERFSSLIKKHTELFGKKNPMLFSASGRTEIAGNHTDHNLGLVIGASINLDTIAAVSMRNDDKIILSSKGFPDAIISLNDLSVKEEEKNSTQSLIRGIANAYKERGGKTGGWEANVSSLVSPGSGLSSSASIEVLIAEIFNNLYNDDSFSPLEMAQIGQYAENLYFGKPSGLMDQVCSATKGMVAIDFQAKENPVLTPLSLDLEEYNLTMVITNTHGSHVDLTQDYTLVPSEMRKIANYFGKESLRGVNPEDFFSNIGRIRNEIKNDRALLRAYHFFSENERVRFMKEEIKEGDIDTFLYNVNESGASSFCFLQNIYPPSSPFEQGLSLAIALSQHILDGEGAVRVHGGGFAGTVQAYVPDHLLDRYIKEMENLFGVNSCLKISFRKKDVARIR